jgi:antitoxin component of RelBE/YafQ-DinJ toxin-antitoxin module
MNLNFIQSKIFSAMGMSLTTAIYRIRASSSQRETIPFEISLTHSENKAVSMREAMAASERIWQSSTRNTKWH